MYGFKPTCDPECPAEYTDIVTSCLAKNPDSRPDFKALVRQLEECMHLIHCAHAQNVQ